jgi:spore coat protein H
MAKGPALFHWLVSVGALLLAGCGRPADVAEAPPPPPSIPRLTNEVQVAPAPPTEPAGVVEDGPSNANLPVYELKMAQNEFLAVERNPFSNDTRPATFVANGQVYEGVRIRVRGAFSRSWPKKSLKIIFRQDKLFDGHHSLDLNSGWRDPAFVRETLAYKVYALCGAPAPISRMVRLNLNGHFLGLFVQVEQPDKGFLNRLNLKGASVYKATSRSNRADERDLGPEQAYQAHYNKETQKNSGYGELQQFCHGLEETQDVLDFFNRNIDLEKYINFLVATVLIQNWDGFDKNHFLVYDGQGSRKWFVVPWDLDRTFGDHWNWSFEESRLPVMLGTRQLPGVTGWNRIEERFFNEPTLRARFLDRLAEMLEKEFTPEKLFPVLDQLEQQISADAVRDRRRWPGAPGDLHSAIEGIKTFITERRTYLRSELKRLRSLAAR